MTVWLMRQRESLVKILAVSSWAMPAVAFGQTIEQPDKIPNKFTTFEGTIESIFDIAIIVAGVVFVILFLVGGIMYLASSGNEEQVKKARALMLDAVVGLVLVVTAWAVGTYVLRLLGIEGVTSDSIPTTVE
ncbi:hypothetical protein HYW32_00070 [Candidatus Berkelbacteria bacterium]|nr:hypothetical protein [Candidatus Berkelbacteria bacterium]